MVEVSIVTNEPDVEITESIVETSVVSSEIKVEITETVVEVTIAPVTSTVDFVQPVVQVAIVPVELTVEIGASGVPGATGPTGPAGSATVPYTHTQGSAATSWTVNHNLGYNPVVSIFSTGGMEIIGEVLHTSINQTVLSFVEAIAGTARFV